MKKLLFFLGAVIIVCSSFQKKKIKKTKLTCIEQKIAGYKRATPEDKPQSVYEYQYKGKKVYYITMGCCDKFNELLDSNCRLLGYPDGGFTGRGDGKVPDFSKDKQHGKLLWKNN